MTVTFTATNAMVSAAALDILTSAFTEAGIQNPQEPLDADMTAWGMEKLQRLLDQINAKRELIFAENFALYTLTPNHAPHTIGPGGDFNVPNTPVRIVGAAFILSGVSSNPVDSPIKIKDADWWRGLPTKSQISSVVTHLYYERDTPLGQLNFWPVCTIANPVRLETWASLSQAVTPQQQIALPQAYWDMIVLSLAVRLCPSYGKEISPSLKGMHSEAMKAVLDNNADPPVIQTNAGMPDSPRAGRPDFNFLTGMKE